MFITYIWPPCLVDVVFVDSCVKSFVNEVEHLKEFKRAAGPGQIVEPVNLGEKDQFRKQMQKQIQRKYI